MRGFVERSRAHHNRSRHHSSANKRANDFTEVELTRNTRRNEPREIEAWDVPSVNFLLGAVETMERGSGRRVFLLARRAANPNAAGHAELLRDIRLPTLFEALEQGKPAPRFPRPNRFPSRIVRPARRAATNPRISFHAGGLDCTRSRSA